MSARYKNGSVVFDRRRGTWRFLWWAEGKRQSQTLGTLHALPTKNAANRAAQPLREQLWQHSGVAAPKVPTVAEIVARYRAERMPTRYSTRRAYNVWLNHRILPRWGNVPITEVQARPVQQWIDSLSLSARSRSDIRALLGRLCDFAQFCGDVPVQRNPMQLVRCPGSSKRIRKPRLLTATEFQKMLTELATPFNTIALLCACFGLRISECLGLRWGDVDWLGARLSVQRAAVRNRVGDTKTAGSERAMFIDAGVLEVLKRWKQETEFATDTDWVFASPSRIGRVPWSYDSTLRAFQRAAAVAGIGTIGTHSMRHSFRSWLDSVGTSIAVQQKCMRHASIKTTMDIYGGVITDEMETAHSKVASLVLNGSRTDRRPS
jgi:integrase